MMCYNFLWVCVHDVVNLYSMGLKSMLVLRNMYLPEDSVDIAS